MTERIHQAELARRLGVTDNAVKKHVMRGYYAKGPDGLFAWPECRYAYEAAVDPSRRLQGALGAEAVSRRTGKDSKLARVDAGPVERLIVAESPISRARAAQLELKNTSIEIEIAKQRGELIAKADVLKACRAVVTTVCERLDGLPGRMAPRVVGLASTEVEAIAREMIAEVRREIASLGAQYAREADG